MRSPLLSSLATIFLLNASLFAQATPAPAPARPADTSRGGLQQRSMIGSYDQLSAEQKAFVDSVTTLLIVGSETEAQHLTQDFLKAHPEDARVALFQATMIRATVQ